jgi:hypothetical protein
VFNEIKTDAVDLLRQIRRVKTGEVVANYGASRLRVAMRSRQSTKPASARPNGFFKTEMRSSSNEYRRKQLLK